MAAVPGGRPARPPAAGWRQWRAIVVIVIIVVLAGIAIALLQSAPAPYLSPDSTAADGTHALADILQARGQQVLSTAAAGSAAAAARPDSTLVITSPQYLTTGQLGSLARVPADLLIVEPTPAALRVLAPAVRIATVPAVGPLPPACRLAAADLAGPADLGGAGFQVQPGTPGASQCYPAAGQATLVQLTAGGRLITVLGSGAPLTNGQLASQGNAALAINLLSAARRVVWLVPEPAAAVGAAPAGPRSFTSLIPLPARLVAIQLGVTVLLLALWRARRLGSLVSEPLPVVVRASETVEGHAALYRSRQARDRAAAALRAATLSRIGPAVGLPNGAAPAAVTATLAGRSALTQQRIGELLYGPAPASEARLVSLADDLDALEEEVRGK